METDDLKTQRAALEAELATLRRAKQDGEEHFGKLDEAVEALQNKIKAIAQAQDAMHRADAAARMGTERELGAYVARDAGELDGVRPQDVQRHYLQNEDGRAVRLTGHFTTVTRGHEQVQVWRWGVLDDPEPRTEAQAHAQRVLTRRNLARLHCRAEKQWSPVADMELMSALRDMGGDVEKIFADSAGIGAEWVPSRTVPELEREIIIPTNFAGLFERRVITPGGTVKMPFARSSLRIYKGEVPTGNDPAAATLSDFTTGERDVDTVPAYCASQIDRDAEADAVFAVADVLLGMIRDAYRFAEDDTIIHGDTAASHQDAINAWDSRGRLGGTSGLGTTADHRRRWIGLRARAYDLDALTSASKTDQSAAKTWDGLRTAIAKMGADNQIGGFIDGADLIVAPSWEYFFDTMLDWTEFASWDKVGSMASVITGRLGPASGPGGMLPGQVGFLAGFLPVCVPYPLASDLETSGLYTDGSGGKTAMLQFNRSRFEYVVRQGMSMESEVNIRNNTVTYVTRLRSTFRALDAAAATVKDVHYSYNL